MYVYLIVLGAFSPVAAAAVFLCIFFFSFNLTAAKQEMTPVSGEVTGCDLNSEEIKQGLSESFDSLSKNNLTTSNLKLPLSQTSEPNMSSTFQRQATFLSCFLVFSSSAGVCSSDSNLSTSLLLQSLADEMCHFSCPEKNCKMWRHQRHHFHHAAQCSKP